jgi:SAM-dependent methyltransferase
MGDASLTPQYFDDLYAANADPWNFSESAYEAEKYSATIDMLGPALYERGLEIGCSIGVLTSRLAKHCRKLLSVDVNERALSAASVRCAQDTNVRFERMVVPGEMPAGPFDLIVLSEVGYYWSDADLDLAKTRIAAIGPGATLELVHFLPRVAEYKRDGDAVHQAFIDDRRFEVLRSSRAERYRIDVLRVAVARAS